MKQFKHLKQWGWPEYFRGNRWLFIAGLILSMLISGSGIGIASDSGAEKASIMGAVSSAEILVDSAAAIRQAMTEASPGDVLVMKNGVWEDALIIFEGNGEEGKPITLRAETRGEVILTGTSSLRMAGNYLVVDGLFFKDGERESGGVIEFRNGPGNVANNSRLTNTAIIDYNPEDKEVNYKWVSLFGQYNRVDHNYFKGKDHVGSLVTVWRSDTTPQYHQIDNNYFSDIPVLGVNGGEAIRIGTSSDSLSSSFTKVEQNLFEQANGEGEIISVKSGENVISRNTFRESQGSITLRHGNGSTVEGNFFLQGEVDRSWGIRVNGEDHRIINNYIEGVRGSTTAALSLIEGVIDSPLHGYHQIQNVTIAHNTFVNNARNIVIGEYYRPNGNQVLPVKDTVLANNVLLGQEEADQQLIQVLHEPEDMTLLNNVAYWGIQQLDAAEHEISWLDPMLEVAKDEMYRPNGGSFLLNAGAPGFAEMDIDGQLRSQTSPDIGADEMTHGPVQYRPLTGQDVGPAWVQEKAADGDPLFQKRNFEELAYNQEASVPWSTDKRVLALNVGSNETYDGKIRTKLYFSDLTLVPELRGAQVFVPVQAFLSKWGEGRSAVPKGWLKNDPFYLPLQVVVRQLGISAYQDASGTIIVTEDVETLAELTEPVILEKIVDMFKITSSMDDGNVPENTMDEDGATRWSAEGSGQWIRYDLGAVTEVGSVGIQFYSGNVRSTMFEVQVSDNSMNWQTVFSGQSSGTTIAEEKFELEDADGRFIRIIGYGNTDNGWNSLSEVKLYDSQGEEINIDYQGYGKVIVPEEEESGSGANERTVLNDAYFYPVSVMEDVYMEAEHFTNKSGLFERVDCESCSGGAYMHTPDGSSDGTESFLAYELKIKSSGSYAINLLSSGPNASSDSFIISINGEEEFPQATSKNGEWEWRSRTFDLTEGYHTFYVKLREDGARLDKIHISADPTLPVGQGEEAYPLPSNNYVISGGIDAYIEAENFTFAEGDFTAVECEDCSGNAYLHTPPVSLIDSYVAYQLYVQEEGAYYFFIRATGLNASADSYFVVVDYEEDRAIATVNTGEWIWRRIDPYELTAGFHTLYIKKRESGARMDKILISQSSDMPDGLGGEAMELP